MGEGQRGDEGPPRSLIRCVNYRHEVKSYPNRAGSARIKIACLKLGSVSVTVDLFEQDGPVVRAEIASAPGVPTVPTITAILIVASVALLLALRVRNVRRRQIQAAGSRLSGQGTPFPQR
jgi:hypothetical protein